MNFEHFLKSIELISLKLYPDFPREEGVQHIIEQHLLFTENDQNDQEFSHDQSKWRWHKEKEPGARQLSLRFVEQNQKHSLTQI